MEKLFLPAKCPWFTAIISKFLGNISINFELFSSNFNSTSNGAVRLIPVYIIGGILIY